MADGCIDRDVSRFWSKLILKMMDFFFHGERVTPMQTLSADACDTKVTQNDARPNAYIDAKQLTLSIDFEGG